MKEKSDGEKSIWDPRTKRKLLTFAFKLPQLR